MLFTLAIAVVAALLAGIVPALQASRPAVVDTLREGGREGAAGASRRTRQVLIAAEVALAFVLLAGAGLLLRTLWSMQHVDRGFSPSRIATMRLSLPAGCVRRAARGAGVLLAAPGARALAAWRRIGRHGDRRPDAAAGQLGDHDDREPAADARSADRVSARDRVAGLLRNAGRHARRRTDVHGPGSRRCDARHHRQRNVRPGRLAGPGSTGTPHPLRRPAIEGAMADGDWRRTGSAALGRRPARRPAGSVHVRTAEPAAQPAAAGADRDGSGRDRRVRSPRSAGDQSAAAVVRGRHARRTRSPRRSRRRVFARCCWPGSR